MQKAHAQLGAAPEAVGSVSGLLPVQAAASLAHWNADRYRLQGSQRLHRPDSDGMEMAQLRMRSALGHARGAQSLGPTLTYRRARRAVCRKISRDR